MQWDASKTGMMQRKGQASEWHTTFVLDDRFHQASVFVFIYFPEFSCSGLEEIKEQTISNPAYLYF